MKAAKLKNTLSLYMGITDAVNNDERFDTFETNTIKAFIMDSMSEAVADEGYSVLSLQTHEDMASVMADIIILYLDYCYENESIYNASDLPSLFSMHPTTAEKLEWLLSEASDTVVRHNHYLGINVLTVEDSQEEIITYWVRDWMYRHFIM